MRRPLAVLTCSLLALGLAASVEARSTKPSWAQKEIRYVVSRGLMAADIASFRAEDPLTRGELNALLAGLTQRPSAPDALASPAPVTLAQLDARLVAALGLSQSAAQFARTARSAGLPVPARFGTEVVARLLALRVNHPDGQDDLELGPADPATRAEAAFSAARVLRVSDWERDGIEEAAAAFMLPSLTLWQQRVLTTAVRLVGYPYVWAGTSERPQSPLGTEVKGGFDCSGFAWRVYRLQKYPLGGEGLASVIRGRTAASMAGEVPASRRVSFARLQPADMVFFGPRGPRSGAASIDHTGIYLGGGWMIHSSRYGVALTSITGGWYRERFAWGRRPLAEANLGGS